MTRSILADYVRAGWALVPIPYGQKGPTAAGWQKYCVTDPEIAAELDGNVGLAHAYSDTCALDIDDMDLARDWLGERGINLDALWNAPDAVRLSSGRPNRGKLIYKLQTPICSKKVVISKQAVLDFRCGTRTGTTVQDVLPPSIHPDTRAPYEWQYADEMLGHWACLPEIPADVRCVWEALIAAPDMQLPVVRDPRIVSQGLGPARAMLFDNDPDCDRDRWVHIGMALHHASDAGLDGLDLWDEWSARGKKYQGRTDLETIWRSFHMDALNPITISSLRVDTPAESEEFEPITQKMVEEAMRGSPAPASLSALKEAVNSLVRDKTGRALAILPNLMPILSVPEVCGQQLAYDSFKDVLICAPLGTELWRPIKDTDFTATRLWLEKAAHFHPVKKDLVRDTIFYIAENHKVDSAQKWLSSLVWDGRSRVRAFMPLYMGTIATEYEYSVGEYLWTALAGRVMEPGCQVDMALILIGAQGIGKSRGVQAIVPDPDYYAEVRLDESDDVIARKIRGVLIGELAELRGIRGEQDRIKAFMTRTHEKWVPKYVEFATTFARRVVFIGTSNDDEIFVDDENRRWLPVRTSGVDVDSIERDRDQLWAEALQLWMERGIYWSGAQQLAKGEHDQYRVNDSWSPLIEQWLTEHPGTTFLRTHDVLVAIIGLDSRHITRPQELRISQVMKHMGFTKSFSRENGKNQRVWIRKSLDVTKKKS